MANKNIWDKLKDNTAVTENKNDTAVAKSSAAQAGTKATVSPSPYAAQRDKLYTEYMGRKPFSYDYTTDPVYQAYEKAYTDKGKLAMEDTIAQSAALTGGYGNTYGHVAGQQVYDNYMKGLNDIVPDLYRDAYSKYTQESDRLYNQYTLAADRADADREQAAAELAAILAAGGTPSDDLIARSGYSSEYVNAMRNYYGSLSSGNGSGGAYSGGNATTAAQVAALYAAAAGEGVGNILSGFGGKSMHGESADDVDALTLLDNLRGGVVDAKENVIGLSDYAAAVQELYDEGLLSHKDYYTKPATKGNKGNARVNEVK